MNPEKELLHIRQTIYTSSRSNQEFYMSQQWRVVYYSTLLYGALIAFPSLKNYICYISESRFGVIVSLVAIILLVGGLKILCYLETSRKREKTTVDNIYRCDFRFKAYSPPPINGTGSLYVFYFLCAADIGGCLFVVLYYFSGWIDLVNGGGMFESTIFFFLGCLISWILTHVYYKRANKESKKGTDQIAALLQLNLEQNGFCVDGYIDEIKNKVNRIKNELEQELSDLSKKPD